MSMADEYATGRTKTIVGMAVSFTSMLRVFRKGSARVVEEMIEQFIQKLSDIYDQRQFDALHEQFCERFVSTICLAKPRNGQHPSASYGHAAKVLDVALKACVDYCQLPDAATSQRVKPLLHAGIDTPILEELKKKGRLKITASTINEIDRKTYQSLQAEVLRQINLESGATILRVMYDDIMWRRLNRADGP